MKLNAKVPEPLGFQLTPMLDVVFILLIFFVVTQKFILNEQDLAVEVPTAAGDENVTIHDQLVLCYAFFLNLNLCHQGNG